MSRGFLKQVIEENDTHFGRIFDLTIQTLIILSLIAFSLETLPDLDPTLIQVIHIFEIISVTVFIAEYFLRIFVADKPLRFIFSFYGLIDLLAILPYLLAPGFDLRSLRSFRLLRLFRAFKLIRYSKAISRFHRAFIIAREELVLFFSVTLLLFFFASVGIYHFEHAAQPQAFSSIFASLWWAVITLTTVGYGDVYPITVGGKMFTFFILLLGLGIVSVPSGMVASALSEARTFEEEEAAEKKASKS